MAWAGSPDSEFLPKSLPKNILRSGFLSYAPNPDGLQAPLFSSFQIKGNAYPSLSDWMSESHHAYLPEGQKIEYSTDKFGREIWNYPTGFRVVHLIELHSTPPEVFELRIVEKLENGRFAFGVYLPAGEHFELMEEADRSQQKRVKSGRRGTSELTFQRINIRSCRHCHSSTTNSRYQYSRIDLTGPCEFAPGTKGLRERFTKEYLKAFGVSPFVPRD